ncbi:flippase [Sulfurimonas sp.]
MIKKIKNKFKSEDTKRLLSNFISLSILQGANYILPIITLPYLVRVLGVENFGLLAFSTATIAYFNIITDYGFNLTATRQISVNREDTNKIVEIFSSVMSIKVILLLMSFFALSILVFSFEKFSQHWEIYFLTFGNVIGQVLFPTWFFQGLERMKYITYINILIKFIFTIAVFIFIHKQSDFFIVPLLTSVGSIFGGIVSLILIKNKFRIDFRFQKINTLIDYLKDGWHIFISGILTSFYTISTTFILGIFTNNTIVGYYSLAEKLVKAVGGLFSPINSTIFPYTSKLQKISPKKTILFINRIILYSSALMFILSLILFIFAKQIIFLISGTEYQNSVVLLKILSFFPLVITIASIFSMNYMINFNLKFTLSKIYLYAAFFSLILSFSLVPILGAIGSAISVMVTEIFATTYMYIIIKRKIYNV